MEKIVMNTLWVVIFLLLIYIISPIDFLPGIEFDDAAAAVVVIILLVSRMQKELKS